MRGHFKKRGDRWYLWAELEPSATGRRRQASRGGFRTRREAETAFAAYRDEIRSGTYVEPDKSTLGTYLVDEWLRPSVQACARPPTTTTAGW